MGKIIQKYNWKRTTYIIVTKIYWSTKSEERGLSRKHIIESVKASLQRLQVDYIDIILIHKADSMCPMEGNFSSRDITMDLNFKLIELFLIFSVFS